MTGLVGVTPENPDEWSVCKQSFAAAPIQYRSDALVQLRRLVLVIMGSTFDPDIFLVWCRECCADRRIVRGGHGIIRLVLHLQYRRAADARRVLWPFRVRHVVAPLRQPRAQRRIARKSGGRGVRGTRIAEITPAGPPSVRVDPQVKPPHV